MPMQGQSIVGIYPLGVLNPFLATVSVKVCTSTNGDYCKDASTLTLNAPTAVGVYAVYLVRYQVPSVFALARASRTAQSAVRSPRQ